MHNRRGQGVSYKKADETVRLVNEKLLSSCPSGWNLLRFCFGSAVKIQRVQDD